MAEATIWQTAQKFHSQTIETSEVVAENNDEEPVIREVGGYSCRCRDS
jgi:hypothetical protein